MTFEVVALQRTDLSPSHLSLISSLPPCLVVLNFSLDSSIPPLNQTHILDNYPIHQYGLPKYSFYHFVKRDIDEDIPSMHASSSPKYTNQGPTTRSCAKKLQEQVNSLLTDCNFDTSKNVILPKCSILILLRFTHEDVEGTWPKDQDMVLQNSSVGKVT